MIQETISRRQELIGSVEAGNPDLTVVHRQDELDVIENQIRSRLNGAQFEGGIVNIHGLPGMGKSVFIQKTLIPDLERNFAEIPAVNIDLDIYKDETRSDLFHSRAKLTLDLIRGLEDRTGIPVTDLLKANRHKALGKWSQSMEVLENQSLHETVAYDARLLETNFVSVFQEYTFTLAHQKRQPVVFILDTHNHITPDEDKWLQEELITPTLETGNYTWVVSGREKLKSVNNVIEKNLITSELKPFDQKQTGLMTEGIDANAVYAYAKGHPEASAIAAKVIRDHGSENTTDNADKKEQDGRVRASLTALLDSERYLGGYGTQTAELIKALSGFESFTLEEFTSVVNGNSKTSAQEGLKINEVLKKLTGLTATGLVRRDGTHYTVLEPLRSLIEETKAL